MPEVPDGASAPLNGPDGNGAQRRRMTSVVSWAVTGLLIALIAAVSFYGATRPAPQPVVPEKKLANVEVTTVRPREYRESLVLPAVLEADRVASVSPEFGGKLARWLVGEGDQTVEGAPVAKLDTSILRASLQELDARRKSARLGVEQAEVALQGAAVGLDNARKQVELQRLALQSAEADRDLARTEYERTRHLAELQVMDRARLDTAENALTQATIRVDQARQALATTDLGVRGAEVRLEEARKSQELAGAGIEELEASIAALEIQIDKATLRAPISGRLEKHLAEPGEVVETGKPLAKIYDLEHLRAVVNVPDRYVAFLDEGNPAVEEYIRLRRPGSRQEVRSVIQVPGPPKLTGGDNPGLEVPARIVRIAQASVPQSNTFPVELRTENPGMALKHGILGRARLEYLTYPAAIVVPLRAVQVTDAGPRVLVVERDGGVDVARVREIVPASVREDELLVLEGLEAGERLIVAGWKGLVSGEAVNVLVENGTVLGAGGEGETE